MPFWVAPGPLGGPTPFAAISVPTGFARPPGAALAPCNGPLRNRSWRTGLATMVALLALTRLPHAAAPWAKQDRDHPTSIFG